MDENVEYEEKENEFDIVSICFAASLIAKHELLLLFFPLKVDWWELSSVYRVPFFVCNENSVRKMILVWREGNTMGAKGGKC